MNNDDKGFNNRSVVFFVRIALFHVNFLFMNLFLTRNLFCFFSLCCLTLNNVFPQADTLTFFAIGDWGREGGFNQRALAETMNEVAGLRSPQFIVSTGDNFYFDGVKSVNDPKWKTSFEDVYTGENLQIPWYPVFGNHDHLGNAQAQLDYSEQSDIWHFPSSYYSKVKMAGATSVRLLFLDTDPYVRKEKLHRFYRKYVLPDSANRAFLVDSIFKMPVAGKLLTDMDTIEDAEERKEFFISKADTLITFKNLRKYLSRKESKFYLSMDTEGQTAYIDSVLSKSSADFIIVVGHHPMYTGGKRSRRENRIKELLEERFINYNVDLYIAGHEHDLQFINPETGTYHVVSGAGSKLRETGDMEHTVYAESVNGFVCVSVTEGVILLDYYNINGDVTFRKVIDNK